MIDRSLNFGRPVIRRFLEDAAPYRTVLDIGAGKGADLIAAQALVPTAELHAIEAYRPYVEILENQSVQVAQLDIERDRLPFEDASLDVVIANQILEHVKEVFWIFHELSRVLRVGGQLIVGVPNLGSLHNRLLLLLGRQPSVIKTASAHVRGFTRHDFLGFLEEVWPGGYRMCDVAGANFYPFPPTLAKPLASALPALAWGLFLRLEKQSAYENAFPEFPANARLETNFFVGPSGDAAN